MAEVADEAGVVRSTVYRYFTSRDELLQHLVVHRADRTFERIAPNLRRPDDAAASLPDLILEPIGMIAGSSVNEALWAPGSRALILSVELESEPMVDTLHRRFGPLLERWQDEGQIHADLDIRETIRWMNAVALILLSPPGESGRSSSSAPSSRPPWCERSSPRRPDRTQAQSARRAAVSTDPHGCACGTPPAGAPHRTRPTRGDELDGEQAHHVLSVGASSLRCCSRTSVCAQG